MLPLQSVEILKKLDKKELKRFGDFLSSPYFNQSELILKIYEAVKKEHPEFSGKLLQSEKMFKKLYPSDEYKETRIQNLYAEFGRLLREFLGCEEINFSGLQFDIFIANKLKRINLFELSNKFIKKSLQQHNDGLLTSPLHFPSLHAMSTCYIHNLSHLRENENQEFIDTYKSESEMTTIFFLKEIFHTALIYSMQKKIFSQHKNQKLHDEVLRLFDVPAFLDYLKSINHKYYSYLKIFYLLYYYTENEISEEQYWDLKKEVFLTTPFTGNDDKLQIITRCIQIILAKLVPKSRGFHEEVFELGKLFCELKIYPDAEMDWLAVGSFRDLLTSPLILQKYEWVEKFIDEYVNYLGAEFRDNELNYWNGILSFKKGNYEDSLNFFNKVQMVDIIEKINIRFYYLMNYIELKAYESAYSSLQTIRQFCNDREIPEMFAVLIPNALKYFNEIIKCEEEGKKLDDQIYDEARDGRRFYHVNYLLGKMEKLKGVQF
ncbi:MAG: hypothetical protein JSS63_02070 [Bacteroidetes bacterium]|nr:hypothetical protein [Bacteroidota bacterium]